MDTDCKVSIMVLGETEVGKTSLLHRFQKDKFSDYQVKTSINRVNQNVNLMGKTVSLEMWDNGGDPRFRGAIKGNYSKVDGALLIFDVTDVATFHKLSGWFEEFRTVNNKAIALIVGNKFDNPDVKTVSQAMVENFASENGLEYFKASAKSGENVNNIFEHLMMKIIEEKNISGPSSSSKPQDSTSPKLSNSVNPKIVEKKISGPINSLKPQDSTSPKLSNSVSSKIVEYSEKQLISHTAEIHIDRSKSLPLKGSNMVADTMCSSNKSFQSANNCKTSYQSVTDLKQASLPKNCATEAVRSSNSYITPPVQLSNSLKQPTETDAIQLSTQFEDDTDWCFPDIDYLKSKNFSGGCLHNKEALPPIIALPNDTIQLHVEKCSQNRNVKNVENNNDNCCQI